MFSQLTVILPIFGLILAGWTVRRLDILPAGAASILNRFVVYLALPALLFKVTVAARWSEIWHGGFVIAFGLATALLFLLVVAARLAIRKDLADATICGLNASYANTGFMGFPLAAVALGAWALPPTVIATIITACVLFGVAIMLIETGLRSGSIAKALAKSLGSPLLVAPAAGTVLQLAGIALPAPAESFFGLLGAAASPCALIALGLFLAEERPGSAADPRTAGALIGLKLIAHPLLTWLIAVPLLNLPAQQAKIAVLLAALPTGTGPFMLAEIYRREPGLTALTILGSTIGSILTISVYLALA